VRQQISEAGLTDHVSFLGWVKPEEMPRLLRKFDVLLLPSIWPEPFSRAVLEGMISGLVVIAARTGGTPEAIVDGENGLLFRPNDPSDLANKIALLADRPDLHEQIREAGRRTVTERFHMSRMMDEMESYLLEVAFGMSTERTGEFESLQNPV
jgi:glycosyltransferase involved in cell wall biosynthesis